jgi:hypothetical protein
MLTVAMLSGRRVGPANAGALQHFLIQLLHDLRLAGLLLRARGDAGGPFGDLHLGFSRLVVEAAPYVADACWRVAWRICPSRTCGPSGKKERGDQKHCRNQNGSVWQVWSALARRLAFFWIRTGCGAHGYGPQS